MLFSAVPIQKVKMADSWWSDLVGENLDGAVAAGSADEHVEFVARGGGLGTQRWPDDERLGREEGARDDGAVGLEALPVGVAVAASRSEHGEVVVGPPQVDALVLAAADDVHVVGAEAGADVDRGVGEAPVLADERQVAQVVQADAGVVGGDQDLRDEQTVKGRAPLVRA